MAGEISPFRTVKLEECAAFQEGYVNPSQGVSEYFGNEVKWLRAVDLNDAFVWETSRRLSRKGYESAGKAALLFEPDTLAISKSGTIGRLGILKDYMCGNRAVINIKPDHARCDTRFIFYSLKVRRPEIETRAVGSVQPNLYCSALGEIEIDLPPLPEQKRIAHVLGTLDDKIELNRRMNATLEGISRAIFKSWFVDFDPVRQKAAGKQPVGMDAKTAALFPDSFEDSEIGEVPKGWRVLGLGDVLELAYGKALKAEDRRCGSVPVFGSNGEVGLHDEALVTGPGIVVGRKGNPGIVTWAATDFFPIDTTFYVVPKDLCDSLYFLFYALQLHDLGSLGGDSAVPGLNRNMAYMSKQSLPPVGLLVAYDKIVEPIFATAHANAEQSRTLAALRDTLLPKLLSGEVRVPEAEEAVEEATR